MTEATPGKAGAELPIQLKPLRTNVGYSIYEVVSCLIQDTSCNAPTTDEDTQLPTLHKQIWIAFKKRLNKLWSTLNAFGGDELSSSTDRLRELVEQLQSTIKHE